MVVKEVKLQVSNDEKISNSINNLYSGQGFENTNIGVFQILILEST